MSIEPQKELLPDDKRDTAVNAKTKAALSRYEINQRLKLLGMGRLTQY